MKKVIKLLLILPLAVLFSSCLQSGIDVTVNKDGSGELVQTFMVLREYMAFMSMGDEAADPNMINRDTLESVAAAMGEGVSFTRVEPAPESGAYAGYKAYYTFKDISKVKTSPTPMTTPGEMVDNSDWISFEFRKGATPRLTVMSPPDEESDMEDEVEEWESQPPTEEEKAQMEQMKQIYKSMHFWLKIHVNGTITNTDALYSANSEVVLMDMSFEKIIQNDKLFMDLTSGGNNDLDKIRGDLEKAGVKIDDREKIEISFK